eukprot:COSAG02_NODE_12242_length_1574_cov_4.128136_1_plen_217_part_00
MSYKSFAITIRPLGGLKDNTIKALLDYVAKCDYGVVVREMENEAAHAHAQIWFNEAKPRGVICTALVRICERTIEDFDAAQKKVLRNGVRIAYSDWYLDYLLENDNKEAPDVRYESVPDSTAQFYPTEAEQDKIQRKKVAVDAKYNHLLELWETHGSKRATYDSVAAFLYDMMYCSKKILVMKDQRTRIDTCKNLLEYILGEYDLSRALKAFKISR